MIYKTISKEEFIEEFRNTGFEDVFSYEALEALYDFLNALDDYELDVEELCHEYKEVTNATYNIVATLSDGWYLVRTYSTNK